MQGKGGRDGQANYEKSGLGQSTPSGLTKWQALSAFLSSPQSSGQYDIRNYTSKGAAGTQLHPWLKDNGISARDLHYYQFGLFGLDPETQATIQAYPETASDEQATRPPWE